MFLADHFFLEFHPLRQLFFISSNDDHEGYRYTALEACCAGQCAAVATGWAVFDRTMGFLTGGPRLQFARHAVSTWPGPWDPGTRMEREAQ